MRKYAAILMILILTGCASTPIWYNKRPIEKNKTVAILPFLDYKEKNNSGQLFTNLFSIYFLKNGFNVAEREKIRQIIKEKEIDLSGMTHDSTKELGTLLNADYILTGAVIDYNSYSSTRQLFYIFEWLQITCSVGVTARLIDINTGEVIWVGSATDQSYSFQEAAEEILNILYKTIAVK